MRVVFLARKIYTIREMEGERRQDTVMWGLKGMETFFLTSFNKGPAASVLGNENTLGEGRLSHRECFNIFVFAFRFT